MRRAGILAVLVAMSCVIPAWGQATRLGLVSPTEARRYGLKRSWHTRVQVDSGSGRVQHLTLYVNTDPELAHTLFEVVYDRGRLRYSAQDRDAFGRPMGPEGAKKRADKRAAELNAAKMNAKVVRRVVEQTTLYATTDRGVVHAIDAETGRTRWAVEVGRASFPTTAAGANDKYVAVLNGSTLYVLNQTNGEIVWQRQVTNVPGAGPALSDDLVFVPMTNGALESYKLEDDRLAPDVYKSHGRAIVQPVTTRKSVAWPTTRGLFYVANSNASGVRYRLVANDTIVTKPGYLDQNFYVSSVDGFVYALHEISGAIGWRLSAGEPISQSPVAIGDTVFTITDAGGLFAIDRETGQEKWWVSGVRSFLSQSKDRLYVTDRAGRIRILDAATGGRVATMPAEVLDLLLVNHQTDRIYVGTSRGVLQCLREETLRYPVVHRGGVDTKTSTDKPKVIQPGPAVPAAPAAGGQNPFGGPNPFNAKPAPAAPAPPAGQPKPNPFGNDPTNPFG